MRASIVTAVLTLVVGVVGTGAVVLSKEEAKRPERAPCVVGTFDSRAVALAYVRSEAFQEYVSAQKVDADRMVERAKSAGDDRLVAALDALGPEMQRRIHRQGFGNAPVDDILARIQERFPDIARRTGVDAIVSRWQLTYRGPGAGFVDVTDALVEEFHPSPETLKCIRDIVAKDPASLAELK